MTNALALRLLTINMLAQGECERELEKCCGCPEWVRRMVLRRPFSSPDKLLNIADEIWWSLSESNWKEAFSHHPRIGDVESLRKRFAGTASLALSEQAGIRDASETLLRDVAECNALYEERFGYIFIVCATGKSAGEMLEILKSRLPHSAEEEITIAAGEQAKITRLRLEKLLNTIP